MFYCGKCKAEVSAGIARCPVCGADVVDNYVVVCSSCGTHNVGGSRFCSSCGGLLPVIRKPVCVICGAKNVPGAKFCSSCGAPMVMNEDTHTEEDIIEQRKQKLRADLIEKERLQAVDEEVAKRRAKISVEERKARELIFEREQECEDYCDFQAKRLDKYKRILEIADSPDASKLKKLAKGVRVYSRFLSQPFAELDDKNKEEAIYICPVCGAENSADAEVCYACGRNKRRSAELAAKGTLVRIAEYGKTNVKAVQPIETIDISDVERIMYEDIPNYSAEPKNTDNKETVLMAQEKTVLEEVTPHVAQTEFQPAFQTAPAYRQADGGFKVAPSFQNAKVGEAYQMPPIVQPVAFVPYVTQDQPLLQYAEGNELKNKNSGSNR